MRKRRREVQASTRNPLYGSLNTESHLPNTASLFPVEGKNINKEKEKKKKVVFIVILLNGWFHMNEYNMTAESMVIAESNGKREFMYEPQTPAGLITNQ